MDHPYLSEFDLELIRILSNDLVFLTTRIVSQLFPHVPLRTIQHRLHRLLALKYLSRRLFPAFYPVPKLHLYLAGLRAPEALASRPPDPDVFTTHRKRALFMTDSAIPHFLLIETVHAKVISESRQPALPQFITWIPSYDRLWQTLHDYGFSLNPDAYIEFRIDGSICPVFLELDTGTERGAALKHKFQAYHDYARSRTFQHHFSAPTFRVLFITTTPRRIQNLLTTLTRYTPHLFWLTTFDAFLTRPLLDAYWSVPPSDTPQSLAAPC